MCVLYFKHKFNANFGVYAVAYGIWRFLIEFARDDHRGELVSGLTPSQFWSIVMVVLGIAYFFVYKYVFKKLMKHPETQPLVRQPKSAQKAEA
jgi:prolipoprotein diacylglyceryltransferase